ncbi:MAG: hypothetical protein ACLGHN_10710 [Bacteriovoracia bacterium]
MKKMLLKILNHLTALINQLPDDSIRMKERKSPIQKDMNLKVGQSKRPPKAKVGSPNSKRKGEVHSDERIFNHPRK